MIPGVLYSMRVERQASTKFSPFEIMFAGRPPRFPTTLEEVTAKSFCRQIFLSYAILFVSNIYRC